MALAVLFIGGGTLGSVTPLLAVAEEIRRQSEISPPKADAPREQNFKFQMSFWGSRHGPERGLVEAAGIPFRSIPAGKLRRYWDVRNLFDLVIVKWAFWIALVRLLRQRPSVVVGAGSFVQVPVMWAAWVLRIPIVIHQLDVRPSLANRLVAPLATRITVTFPPTACSQGASALGGDPPRAGPDMFGRKDITVIGAPVRRAILAARDLNQREAKRHFGFSGDRPVLLILGGGTGAQALNELVWGALPEFLEHTDVIHVAGPGKNVPTPPRPPSRWEGGKQKISSPPDETVLPLPEGEREGVGERGWGDHYRSFELLTDDLPRAYAAADLVVSRAGMGTIAELAALGKPCVLIPMPGTHQEANAAALEAAGAAAVWDQRALTLEAFVARTSALLADSSRRAALSRTCASVLPIDTATQIADILREVTKNVASDFS